MKRLRMLLVVLSSVLLLYGCETAQKGGRSAELQRQEPKDAVEKGSLQKRTLPNDPSGSPYYIYVPSSGGTGKKVFAAVHGLSRDAELNGRLFAPFAEAYGVVLVAPLFPENDFSDYAQLGWSKQREIRADEQFDKVIADVKRLTGADTERMYLFGYSAGAQFAHRYTMAHPERIVRYAVGAAGWYTFPDRAADYPRGLGPSPDMRGLAFDPQQFLQIPALVMVGEKDTSRNAPLNTSPDIDSQQGRNRVERGERWAEAMKAAAQSAGFQTDYPFRKLKGAGHDFEKCMTVGKMGTFVFEFMFGSAPS